MKEQIKQRIEQIKNGDIPKGYIKKYKYVFPDTWNLVNLGSITKRKSEKNKDRNDLKSYSINNQVGFIQQDEQFSEGSYQDVDKTNYKVVKPGAFAYNPARINIGSIGLQKETTDVIVSSLYVCFGLDESCDKTYFENWFKSYDFNKEITRNLEGSVREYLFYENFSNIKLPIPSFDEQQKIAEILMQCDKVIELKQKHIEEEKKLKIALMQKLLNPDSVIRLSGFKGEWKEVRLRDCCISNGKYGLNAPSCEFSETLPRYLRITDIDDNGKYTSANEVSVDCEEWQDYTLRYGDLLFVRTGGTVGKVYKYRIEDGNLVYAGFLIKFSVDTAQYDSTFIYAQFGLHKYEKWIKTMSARSGQPGINAEEYADYKFYVPPIEEQKAISKIITSSEERIDLLQKDLEQWQQKKKSLMQLLLTGIVRVQV